ncbi:MAG TPA: hypothetical protein VJ464_13380 [Blastocatellia bacterium]|nr:hypothetical protein [Blastocatellia bacterium]
MQTTASKSEHYRAFNQEFFLKHQRTLIWLLNTTLTRYWFRLVLRIHKDCPRQARIVEIFPHAYVWFAGYVKVKGQWQEQRVADFRTHPKFGKRLYHAFKPLWWAMHAWDLLADQLTPSLSFGFSTLTQYPDASPASTAMNAGVARDSVNESFSTIRSGSGNYSNSSPTSESPAQIVSSSTSNQYATIERGIFLFDTSAITSVASVSAATFSLYVTSKIDNFSLSVALVGSTPASNTSVANSDYGQLGLTRFASDVAISSITTSAYNDWGLNGSGLAAISLTGVTKLGTRADKDLDNSAPTWASSTNGRIVASFANNAGTSQDPKLVVTYAIPNVTISVTVLSGVLSLQASTVRIDITSAPILQAAIFSINSPTVMTEFNVSYESKYTTRGTSHESKYTLRNL